MDTPAELTRPERLSHLARFCPALAAALAAKDSTPDRVFVAFRDFTSMTCSECNCPVSGGELYILSQPVEGEDLTPELRRLRLGYCANPHCKSDACNLTFKPTPEVDWPDCLRRADQMLEESGRAKPGYGKDLRRQLIRPVIILVATLLLMFVLWQLYFGGRIPLIREPEKFRLDVAPER